METPTRASARLRQSKVQSPVAATKTQKGKGKESRVATETVPIAQSPTVEVASEVSSAKKSESSLVLFGLVALW